MDSKQYKEALFSKISNRSAIVGVIGLGYVGLPLAVEKAKMGFRILGIEQNIQRAAQINVGQNYIPDVIDAELQEFVIQGKIQASTDFSRVGEMDVIIIAVPTPLTKNLIPHLGYIKKVCRELVKSLRSGQLICLESTTYPGTTDDIMLPILEGSTLKVEKDFFLAHSPERVDPGNKRYTTTNISKVVGGVGPHSLELATYFYQQTILTMVPVSSARCAELVKVFENTFRAVNIALVNELTLLCDRMGLSIWEVLDAAFTKPFGIMPFYPGPGVGGHCIPLDPHYLEFKAKEFNFHTHFIALAGEINRKMPEFTKEKTIRILNKIGVTPSQAKVLILGVAYKKDLGDCRESPALAVMKLLKAERIHLQYHDPFVPDCKEYGFLMESVSLTDEIILVQDLVIITTDHTDVDYTWIVKSAKHVFDTRNATRQVQENREKITLL